MEKDIQEISEVVKEVRRIRHEISAKFGHDPRKFGEYCRKLGKELRKSGKYKFAEPSQKNLNRQNLRSLK